MTLKKKSLNTMYNIQTKYLVLKTLNFSTKKTVRQNNNTVQYLQDIKGGNKHFTNG